MQNFGMAIVVVYGSLLVVGGVIGWRVSGSRVSLTASLASAALLAVAYRISLSNAFGGYLLATAVALGLAVVFSRRLRKTKKFMPSGMMLAVSSVAALLLAGITALSW
jgi:uncharacterized membrane protein (UPF0136 family)